MTAAEHFDWAIGRAMEYVEINEPGDAMASLISDLRKHPGTEHILTTDLIGLFVGEIMLGGTTGARRFIEGLPRPVEAAVRTAPNADLAYRVLDQIDAHPESWAQEAWVDGCGTAYCFAGWALTLTGHKLKPHDDGFIELDGRVCARPYIVSGTAARELGISGLDYRSTASNLFYPYNTRKDLGRIVAETFGPRPTEAATQ